MNKIFLYLYPIKEYAKTFYLGDDYYKQIGVCRPFDVLNETIQKRYRDKGYQVVFAIYPNKSIYGIEKQKNDKIIYTDISFSKASIYDEYGAMKTTSEIIYPNEQKIINQLGNIDELIIGGYHAQDCVKRVGEVALENGINTLIDLDMTDLFFTLYRKPEYFKMELYNPERFKKYMLEDLKEYGEEFAEELFNRNYQSLAYGFNTLSKKIK